MMLRSLPQPLSSLIQNYCHVAPFIALSFTLGMSATIGGTLIPSLFLSQVGVQQLPLLYLFSPVIVILASTGIMPLIQRWPTPKLYCFVSLVALLLSLLCQGAIAAGFTPAYYLLLIVSEALPLVTWGVLFWALVPQYFTPLELQWCSPAASFGNSLGSLAGGGLVVLGSIWFSTEYQLWVLPIFYGLHILQILWVDRTQSAIPDTPVEDGDTERWVNSLKQFSDLALAQPIIFYLSWSSFLTWILYYLCDYLSSAVYARSYTEQEHLTRFLGAVNMGSNFLELVLLSVAFPILIQRLGVGAMNLIYPLSNLLCLIGLAMRPGVPAAIALGFSAYSLYQIVAEPLTALNYNAVPPHSAKQVRVMLEGILAPMGSILAGGVLIVLQQFGSFAQVQSVALGVAAIATLVSYKLSQNYRRLSVLLTHRS